MMFILSDLPAYTVEVFFYIFFAPVIGRVIEPLILYIIRQILLVNIMAWIIMGILIAYAVAKFGC